jgi:hypothetical protein
MAIPYYLSLISLNNNHSLYIGHQLTTNIYSILNEAKLKKYFLICQKNDDKLKFWPGPCLVYFRKVSWNSVMQLWICCLFRPWTCPQQISGTTGQNFMKLCGVIYMFLVGPKVFRFVVKGVKVIFLEVQGGGGYYRILWETWNNKNKKNNNNNNKKRSKNNKSPNVVWET